MDGGCLQVIMSVETMRCPMALGYGFRSGHNVAPSGFAYKRLEVGDARDRHVEGLIIGKNVALEQCIFLCESRYIPLSYLQMFVRIVVAARLPVFSQRYWRNGTPTPEADEQVKRAVDDQAGFL